VVAVVMAGACSSSSQASVHQKQTQVSPTTSPRRAEAISFPAHVPDGMLGQPSSLAGDPAGEGVWMLGPSRKGPVVAHFRAPETTFDQFELQAGSDFASQSTTRSGLGVDAHGVVWAGGALELVRYDTAGGGETHFDLEKQLQTVADETPLPPEKKGYRVVNALAVTPDGTKVVVGFEGSSRLLVFEPEVKRWSKLELGPQTALAGLAVSETSVVAAAVNGLGTGRNVMEVWVAGARTDIPTDVGRVTYRDGRFVRGSTPTVVDASDGATVPMPITDPKVLGEPGMAFAGGNGAVIRSMPTGFTLLDERGDTAGIAEFPLPACPPTPVAPTSELKRTTSTTQPSACVLGVTMMLVGDGAGDYWFTEQLPTGATVGRLDPRLAHRP
jgi:hypothetical protein